MKKVLLTLILFALQSCNSAGTYEIWGKGSIDNDMKQEITNLNNKLLKAFFTKDESLASEILAPKLIEGNADKFDSLIDKINPLLKSETYRVLDEYHIHYSTTGMLYHVPPGNAGNKDFSINYTPINKDIYVALILPNGLDNDVLITAIYGKYDNGLKLNILQFGTYAIWGETASDLFNLAKESYDKGYLIDAANLLYLSSSCIQPAGEFIQYEKESEIISFYEKAKKEVYQKYQFPLTLEMVDTKPKVFNISPEIRRKGFCPVIKYLSTIDLKDTALLKTENEKIKKEIGQVFTGIDKEKEKIYYEAYNEIPTDKKKANGYRFIDDRTK